MSDLPPNWYATQAPDGRTYYYHGVTNETRWTKPEPEAGGNAGGAGGNANGVGNNNSSMNGSPGSNNSSMNGSPQNNSNQQQSNHTNNAPAGGSSGGQGSSGQQLWKVYKTKEGKSYYYNTVTKKTQWNVPDDLQEGGEKKESVTALALKQMMANAAAAVTTEDRNAEEDDKPIDFTGKSKEERRELFVSLLDDFFEDLHEKTKKFKCKWEECLRKIETDRRFPAIETGGERKQIFHEVMQKVEITIRNKQKKQKVDAKIQLMDTLKTRWTGAKLDARFGECMDLCENEPCWDKLNDDERGDIFQEFMDGMERDQKAERKRLLDEKKKEFVTLLVNDDRLDRMKTKWQDVQSYYKEHELWTWLELSEVVQCFKEFQSKKGDVLVGAVRSKKFRKERDARREFRRWLDDNTISPEDYPEALAEIERRRKVEEEKLSKGGDKDNRDAKDEEDNRDDKVKRESSRSGSRNSRNGSRSRRRSRKNSSRVKKEEGEDADEVKKEEEEKDEFRKISVETTWPELIRIFDLTQVPAYMDALDSQAGRGTGPKDLFQAHLKKLLDDYEEDKGKVGIWLDQEKMKSSRDRLFEMTLISTEDEIFKFADKKKANMNPMNLHYIFKELMIELEDNKKKSEREQKKQRQRLVEILADKKEIKASTTFEEAEELLGRTEAWKVVDEATRRTMFDSFISQITAMGDREDEDAEQGSQRNDSRGRPKDDGGKRHPVDEDGDAPIPREPPRGSRRDGNRSGRGSMHRGGDGNMNSSMISGRNRNENMNRRSSRDRDNNNVSGRENNSDHRDNLRERDRDMSGRDGGVRDDGRDGEPRRLDSRGREIAGRGDDYRKTAESNLHAERDLYSGRDSYNTRGDTYNSRDAAPVGNIDRFLRDERFLMKSNSERIDQGKDNYLPRSRTDDGKDDYSAHNYGRLDSRGRPMEQRPMEDRWRSNLHGQGGYSNQHGAAYDADRARPAYDQERNMMYRRDSRAGRDLLHSGRDQLHSSYDRRDNYPVDRPHRGQWSPGRGYPPQEADRSHARYPDINDPTAHARTFNNRGGVGGSRWDANAGELGLGAEIGPPSRGGKGNYKGGHKGGKGNHKGGDPVRNKQACAAALFSKPAGATPVMKAAAAAAASTADDPSVEAASAETAAADDDNQESEKVQDGSKSRSGSRRISKSQRKSRSNSPAVSKAAISSTFPNLEEQEPKSADQEDAEGVEEQDRAEAGEESREEPRKEKTAKKRRNKKKKGKSNTTEQNAKPEHPQKSSVPRDCDDGDKQKDEEAPDGEVQEDRPEEQNSGVNEEEQNSGEANRTGGDDEENFHKKESLLSAIVPKSAGLVSSDLTHKKLATISTSISSPISSPLINLSALEAATAAFRSKSKLVKEPVETPPRNLQPDHDNDESTVDCTPEKVSEKKSSLDVGVDAAGNPTGSAYIKKATNIDEAVPTKGFSKKTARSNSPPKFKKSRAFGSSKRKDGGSKRVGSRSRSRSASGERGNGSTGGKRKGSGALRRDDSRGSRKKRGSLTGGKPTGKRKHGRRSMSPANRRRSVSQRKGNGTKQQKKNAQSPRRSCSRSRTSNARKKRKLDSRSVSPAHRKLDSRSVSPAHRKLDSAPLRSQMIPYKKPAKLNTGRARSRSPTQRSLGSRSRSRSRRSRSTSLRKNSPSRNPPGRRKNIDRFRARDTDGNSVRAKKTPTGTGRSGRDDANPNARGSGGIQRYNPRDGGRGSSRGRDGTSGRDRDRDRGDRDRGDRGRDRGGDRDRNNNSSPQLSERNSQRTARNSRDRGNINVRSDNRGENPRSASPLSVKSAPQEEDRKNRSDSRKAKKKKSKREKSPRNDRADSRGRGGGDNNNNATNNSRNPSPRSSDNAKAEKKKKKKRNRSPVSADEDVNRSSPRNSNDRSGEERRKRRRNDDRNDDPEASGDRRREGSMDSSRSADGEREKKKKKKKNRR